MAREVYVWAVKRKVKGIALNQVFLHIASWAGPDGFCKFRSVRDIAVRWSRLLGQFGG